MSSSWPHERRDGLRVLGLHPVDQVLGLVLGHLGQHVGGGVGRHRLEHVGRLLGIALLGQQLLLDPRIFDLGQDARGRLDLERLEDVLAGVGGQVLEDLGEVGRMDRGDGLLGEGQAQAGRVGHRRHDVLPADQLRRTGGSGPAGAAPREPRRAPSPTRAGARGPVDRRRCGRGRARPRAPARRCRSLTRSSLEPETSRTCLSSRASASRICVSSSRRPGRRSERRAESGIGLAFQSRTWLPAAIRRDRTGPAGG